jgi:hypothetical protein
MEKPMIENLQKVADAGYLPFTDFQERMEEIGPFPYQSSFSFFKLIEKLRAKSDSLKKSPLADTIKRLEAIEARLQEKSAWTGKRSVSKMNLIFF